MARLGFREQALIESFLEWVFQGADQHTSEVALRCILMNVERILPEAMFYTAMKNLHSMIGKWLEVHDVNKSARETGLFNQLAERDE